MTPDVLATLAARKPAISVEVVGPEDIAAQLVPTLSTGSGSATTYIWNQVVALSTWTVPHNLNRYPSVTVVDGAGRRIESDITYVSSDIVQVTHGAALSGKAYLN